MSRVASKKACEFSLDDLREYVESAGRRSLYLWTFTFAECIDIAEGKVLWALYWSRQQRKWKRAGVEVRAVRVFEMHSWHGNPEDRGEQGGHGMHVHVVMDSRRGIRSVMAVWGLGRVNVKRIPAGKARYVAKYLVKSAKRKDFPPGTRLWGASRLASGRWASRVADMQYVDVRYQVRVQSAKMYLVSTGQAVTGLAVKEVVERLELAEALALYDRLMCERRQQQRLFET